MKSRVLFVQGGSRWKFDEDGKIYTDSNFDENIWKRYKFNDSELSVILRRENKIYNSDDAKSKFNLASDVVDRCIALPDIYKPRINFFSVSKICKIISTIRQEVKCSDYVVIRSLGNIYTNTALKYAQKYKKKYLVEVTGFAFESLWYHSLLGKLIAPIREIQYRTKMKDVDYAVYVTETALQKRYPCKGQMLGCSDVSLLSSFESTLENRINLIRSNNRKLVIGTAAFLDVNWKGQSVVIKALSELSKQGIDSIEYQLIGAGSGKKLRELAKKLNVSDRVNIIGVVPHESVFEWFDSIDIYIQPSFTEGLCRSIVEAMSRACPVICSDVGGNYELISKELLFKAGDYIELSHKICHLIETKQRIDESVKNFEKSKLFDKNVLNQKRELFYKHFFSS